MKKLLFMGALLLSATSFANDKCEEEKDVVAPACCTAYLWHNGEYVDEETVCGFITQGDNCKIAQQKLLDRHKDINPSGQI